jgi:hypothetical protein
MITLNGTAKREIFFPADISTTIRYFSDLQRLAPYLPHITVVENFGPNELRFHYHCVELGAYDINLFADVLCVVDQENLRIDIKPIEGENQIKAKATLSSTRSQGLFTSVALFYPAEEQTFIDYRLQIAAKMPRPRGMRMMPGRIVNRIVKSISHGRVQEIADGFIENVLAAFPAWLAQQSLTA